jgi:hypothetical protein
MKAMMRAAAIGVAVLVAGCSGFASPHEIVAPPEGRVNMSMTVAVTGSFTSADTLRWTATGGTFQGETNVPNVRLVPSAPGPLSVVLTITSADGSTRTLERTIPIAPVAGSGGGAPPVAADAPPAAPRAIDSLGYVPSGFMGDGADVQRRYLQLNSADRTQPHSPPAAYKMSYKPGPVGWAAIAWQYPQNNWGDLPGRNLSADGYKELSVWARSDPDPRTGAFPAVQFKSGGATDPSKKHQASFEAIGEFHTLTSDWKEYRLSLGNADLSNVASAFIVVIRAQDVPVTGATVYLDDITLR